MQLDSCAVCRWSAGSRQMREHFALFATTLTLTKSCSHRMTSLLGVDDGFLQAFCPMESCAASGVCSWTHDTRTQL